MKAVRIHEFGGSGVLTLDDVPRPEPSEGEVLIRVRAAGVNPVDWKIRSGAFGKSATKLPVTLGRDVSGVALDRRLDLPNGAARGEVEQAMKDHVIADAELMGHYAPPVE